MMYTFKRLQHKEHTYIIGWYLEIKSYKELLEYKLTAEKSILNRTFADEFSVIQAEAAGWKQHPANRLNEAIHTLMNVRDCGWMDICSKITIEGFRNQKKCLEEGYQLYFNSSLMGYMIDKDGEDYLTLDEYTSDKIMFPDYKDAKFTQWDGGKHWYVRVGNIDIYDKDGNMKWNTRKEAEEALEWYKGSV